MEDYEIFCRKHLARIQEEAVKGKTSFTIQNKNVSLIQFYGVPVLSPLVSSYFIPFPPWCANCAIGTGFDMHM